MTKYKMKTKYDPDIEPTSTAGGWCLLIAAGCGLMAGLFAAAPDVGILLVWVIGSWAVWRAAKNVHSTPDPAPPPVPERGSQEEPQVSMLRDPTHPNRWVAARPSRWLDWRDESRDES